MAVLLELAVNFGISNEAAEAAAELVRRVDHIDVRGVPVPLTEAETGRSVSRHAGEQGR